MTIKERIRSYDVFGSPVGLTYKGDSSFKTVLGGIICILASAIILSAALEQFIEVFGM